MQLFYSPTSPYARNCRVVARERGLMDRIEERAVSPYDDPPELLAANPLARVPTLLRDDGSAVFDSPVICAYLDALSPGPALIPDGPRRWDVLTREALADGILDAAFAMVMERRRPDPQQSPDWLARWAAAIVRSLDAVEADIAGFGGDITIAQLGLGAALGYLDFRLPDLAWRTGRPQTEAWFEAFSTRECMRETAPAAG